MMDLLGKVNIPPRNIGEITGNFGIYWRDENRLAVGI